MLTRIVKLTIDPNKTEEFVKIFDENKVNILQFHGLESIELNAEINHQNIFFTISKWQSENDLNIYRNSPYFKDLWPKIKPLFCQQAEAWSLSSLQFLSK